MSFLFEFEKALLNIIFILGPRLYSSFSIMVYHWISDILTITDIDEGDVPFKVF